MTALLVILALVALYVAIRFYSASKSAKPDDTQPVTPPSDAFGEKFPNPTAPLKTQTLEEWLNEHPDLPLPQPVSEPEPKIPNKLFTLAGKLLPPVPHVRKRKGNK